MDGLGLFITVHSYDFSSPSAPRRARKKEKTRSNSRNTGTVSKKNRAWLEQDFWGKDTFGDDSGDVAIWKLVGRLLLGTCG